MDRGEIKVKTDRGRFEVKVAPEVAAQLREALETLPFEQREVVTLWASGFDLEAMAELTGAPPDTVLSRKKYALGRLRHAMRRLIRERETS